LSRVAFATFAYAFAECLFNFAYAKSLSTKVFISLQSDKVGFDGI